MKLAISAVHQERELPNIDALSMRNLVYPNH
jgi:hypothetical protein